MEYTTKIFRQWLCLVSLTLISMSVLAETLTMPLTNLGTAVFSLDTAMPATTVTVDVNSGSRLVIDVLTDVPINVDVTDPNGVVLSSTLVEHHTVSVGDAPPLGAALFAEGEHALIQVDSPISGTWSLALSLPTGSPGTTGSVTSLVSGGLTSKLIVTRSEYRTDQDVVLGALVFDQGQPVVGANVVVDIFTDQTVLNPDVTGLQLLDDGVSPDTAAGDGIYTGSIIGLAPGHYLTEAVIGVFSQSITSAANFEVNAPLASFTNAVNDSGTDANGDGLIDEITLTFGIDVEADGDYGLTAELSVGGKSVNAGVNVPLDATSTSIDVAFPTDDIKEFLGENGPYEIGNVRLVKLGNLTAGEINRIADQRGDFGVTQAYDLANFQRPITVILSGLTDVAVDNDANGLFDNLVIEFEIDSLKAAGYTWSGDIRTLDGQILGVASNSGSLSAAVNTVALTFKGEDIGKSGENGPYTVANVAAYGPIGGADVIDLLGETSSYSATQFEGGVATFEFLNRIVTELVITGVGGVPHANIIRSSLLHKLENAQRLYEENEQVKAATKLVDAFVNEVQAQAGIHISDEDAEMLITLANQLAASLL